MGHKEAQIDRKGWNGLDGLGVMRHPRSPDYSSYSTGCIQVLRAFACEHVRACRCKQREAEEKYERARSQKHVRSVWGLAPLVRFLVVLCLHARLAIVEVEFASIDPCLRHA